MLPSLFHMREACAVYPYIRGNEVFFGIGPRRPKVVSYDRLRAGHGARIRISRREDPVFVSQVHVRRVHERRSSQKRAPHRPNVNEHVQITINIKQIKLTDSLIQFIKSSSDRSIDPNTFCSRSDVSYFRSSGREHGRLSRLAFDGCELVMAYEVSVSSFDGLERSVFPADDTFASCEWYR